MFLNDRILTEIKAGKPPFIQGMAKGFDDLSSLISEIKPTFYKAQCEEGSNVLSFAAAAEKKNHSVANPAAEAHYKEDVFYLFLYGIKIMFRDASPDEWARNNGYDKEPEEDGYKFLFALLTGQRHDNKFTSPIIGTENVSFYNHDYIEFCKKLEKAGRALAMTGPSGFKEELDNINNLSIPYPATSELSAS